MKSGAEVGLADDRRDQRRDDAGDEGGDDGAERRADDHGDGQVDDVAAQDELAELLDQPTVLGWWLPRSRWRATGDPPLPRRGSRRARATSTSGTRTRRASSSTASCSRRSSIPTDYGFIPDTLERERRRRWTRWCCVRQPDLPGLRDPGEGDRGVPHRATRRARTTSSSASRSRTRNWNELETLEDLPQPAARPRSSTSGRSTRQPEGKDGRDPGLGGPRRRARSTGSIAGGQPERRPASVAARPARPARAAPRRRRSGARSRVTRSARSRLHRRGGFATCGVISARGELPQRVAVRQRLGVGDVQRRRRRSARSRSASTSASVSISEPRAMLTIHACGFIAASSAAPTRWRVPSVAGAAIRSGRPRPTPRRAARRGERRRRRPRRVTAMISTSCGSSSPISARPMPPAPMIATVEPSSVRVVARRPRSARARSGRARARRRAAAPARARRPASRRRRRPT